jgi:glycine oxidase
VNVLVIGAGVIGASIADAVASRGARVTVVDMRSPGRGASQASGGMLVPFVEAHDDDPLLDLCTRSLALFDPFIERIRQRSELPIDYARTGSLQVALSVSDVETLQQLSGRLGVRLIACDWIEGAALARYEPALSSSARGALRIEPHGWVAVPSLVSALVQAARLSGAWYESPVEIARVEQKGDIVEVKADDRLLVADAVVIAAGAWSGRVRVANVAVLPCKPIRGQMLHLTWSGPQPPQRIVWGPRCYTIPWSDGTLLVGATVEDVGFDERSTVAGVRDLLDAVGELLPDAAEAALREVRVGLRPASIDGLPIIGPLARAPRVCVATGHYRNGIMLAPLTAEIVANYVLDGTIDPAFALTSPDRF